MARLCQEEKHLPCAQHRRLLFTRRNTLEVPFCSRRRQPLDDALEVPVAAKGACIPRVGKHGENVRGENVSGGAR